MPAFIYTYSDGDFAPDNVAHLGYVFSRTEPMHVDDETAAKLREHPHFTEVGSAKKAEVAVDKSGMLEASGIMTPDEIKKEKKNAYMREYMHRKRSGA